MVVMSQGRLLSSALRSVAAGRNPLFHRHVFSMSRRWGSSLHTIDPLGQFFLFPVALKCWCGTIATMFSQAPRRDSQDLYCFPSWLYLLDGEDNCMLSVPFSTSDLHYSCWQSDENCQVLSAGAFTLLCYAFWFSLKFGCSPCFSVLLSCPRVVCSMFPVI